MQSLFGGGELGLLGGGGDTGGLKEDGCGSVAWNSSTLPPDDVYSVSHFALITAYQDIKTRLACLERENTSIKRKLKMYEIKVKVLHFRAPSQSPKSQDVCILIIIVILLLSDRKSPVLTRIRLLSFVIYWGCELSTHPLHFPFLLRALRLYRDKRRAIFSGL